MSPSLLDRYQGCLLGLACGDAVGTTVEDEPRGSFEPVTDMVGGGPFRLPPGAWTDDTSMALCLAESLIACGRFDALDQMRRYLRWMRDGHLSSTGHCVDIDNATSLALRRFEATGIPASGSTHPTRAGNGSLMRLAPVVLFLHPDLDRVHHFAAESSRTTHAAPEAVEGCVLLADRIAAALAGLSKAEILARPVARLIAPQVRALATAEVADRRRADIVGSGYAVASLEAALWCVATTSSFEDAILSAANLGDDADTTAAITGQLAGAHYGVGSIPAAWLDRLVMQPEIRSMATRLHALATAPRASP